jgi:hypothetical protein
MIGSLLLSSLAFGSFVVVGVAIGQLIVILLFVQTTLCRSPKPLLNYY